MEKIKEIYYFFYRLWYNEISYFPKRIKWFFQRGWRGYADCDTWDFHSYLCKVIPGGLKQLAEENVGCPRDLYDCPEENKNKTVVDCEACKKLRGECVACHKWTEILNEIASGFERYLDEVLDDGIGDRLYKDRKFEKTEGQLLPRTKPKITDEEWKQYEEDYKKEEEEIKKTIKLFGKYFGNLWD